jgi:hypothetical protein
MSLKDLLTQSHDNGGIDDENQVSETPVEAVVETSVDKPIHVELPEELKDVDIKLKDLEKQTEKLAKSLQKLSSPKTINGKTLQLGVNVRIDNDGFLKIVESPSDLHGKRVAGRVKSYIVSLHILQKQVREAQAKLANAETLSETEIRTLKESEKNLQKKANDQWGKKEEERAEYNSIAIVSKAISRSAQREASSDFDKVLDEKIQKIEITDEKLQAYSQDTEKEREIFEKFNQKFAELLPEGSDPEYVENFFKSLELTHLRWALAQEAITIDDITEEDILYIKEQIDERSKKELAQHEDGLVEEAEIQTIASEILGDSEASDSFRNQLKEFAEITASHESTAVRARTEFATELLDRLVSRTSHQNLYDENDIDKLFKELGLDTENVPEESRKNYESADIINAAYKSILHKRNDEILEQQQIRYKAVESSLSNKHKEEVSELDNGSTKDRIKKMDDVISLDPEIKKQADDGLKEHFVNEILAKIDNVAGVEEVIDKVEIEFQKNGYYVLVVKDRDTFSKLTGSQSDNTFGAAFKHDNIFIRLVDNESQKKIQEEINSVLLPEDDIVAEHEITHLKFDDARKIKIAREKYFHASKILNLVLKENPAQEENSEELLKQIIDILGKPPKDREDAMRNLAEENELSVLLEALSGETSEYIVSSKQRDPNDSLKNKNSSTKVARLLQNYDERILEIDYENKEDNRYFQVEELAAELFGEFAEMDTKIGEGNEGEESVKIKKELDISAIGLGSEDKLEATRENENGEVEFIVHNIEAANMLRILNMASLKIDDSEKRKDFIRKWSKRIMTFEEFSQENTLLFLFELQNKDGIDISEEIQESESGDDEEKYLKIANRYKDGAFTHFLKQMLRNGELSGFSNNQELQDAIENTYEIYSKVVKIGFNFEDLKTDKTRDVENENFKFASRPFYDGIIKMHNDMGVIGYDYSKAWPGGINYLMEGLGLKRKDVAEKGLMIRRGKDENGKTGWIFGYDATTIPVKPSSNLPFGRGEVVNNIFGMPDEGFTKKHYVERLGIDMLYMDIAEIFNLLQHGISTRLQESKLYSSKSQIYLLLDRIGLVHFHDGDIDTTYNALSQQRDEYLSSHLYSQTDLNGELLDEATSRRSTQGDEIYQRLVDYGYSGLDLHLLMESLNNEQRLQLRDGSIHTINTEEKPMYLGVINMRLAQRTKMMRFEFDSKTDPEAKAHIKEGEQFDELSKFMMEVNYDAYDKKEYDDLFTIADLIKASIEVDNILPGDKSAGTDTLRGWKDTKSTVKLTHRGKTFEVDRALLKKYVRSFFYARTYEAMATGVHGNETVVEMNDKIEHEDSTKDYILSTTYELGAGAETFNKQQSELLMQNLMSINFNHAEQQYNKWRDVEPDSFPIEWNDLPAQEKLSILHHLRIEDAKEKGFQLIARSKPVEINDDSELKSFKVQNYKKLGKAIYYRPPGGYAMTKIDSHNGVKKSDMNIEFKDFSHHDKGTDENAYSLGSIQGKLINKVEDVMWEKQQVNYMYYYFKQLMVQADNYRVAASKDKEKWVGIARANMLLRWLQTGMTLMALAGIGPLGFLLNPWVIIALLGNYFVIGNFLTKQGNLHGKRKVAAIKAVNELKQLEPNFEKALFDPDFSLGPERDRLFQLCKVAEDILKGSLVTSVETPNNILEEVSKSLAETGKKFATGD